MKNNGFSLVEVLVATALVGVAIVALVAANSVFTQNNSAALDLSTAEYLIEQIRELTMLLPVVDPQTGEYFITKEATLSAYDNIGDFDGETFGPPEGPINADRQRLGVFADFSQKVTVKKVNPSNFADPNPYIPPSPFVRVTVEIYHHGYKLSSESWIRAKY
jgi:prepilin-type N-terminal cleavage/methylation domain-containing protein